MILDEISKNTNLNENEQQILKYITQHIDEIPTLSSRELARRTYTSSTAVLRCIKKLGFQNSVNNFVSLIYITTLKYIFDLIYAALFSRHYDSTIEKEDNLLRLFERK